MSEKTCKYLNDVNHWFILASIITGCVSISTFTSLLVVPVGILSSAKGLKICLMAAGIKKYESTIKKNKKYDKIVLLRKAKLDVIEVLISKALIDSYINHDEFVLVNNVLREYNEIKEEIKNPETSVEYII